MRQGDAMVVLSYVDYVALPLSERITAILSEGVTFYSRGRALDTRETLAALRLTNMPGR